MLAALKTVLRPAARLARRTMGALPVNLHPRDSSPAAVERDVAYALSIGLQYRDLIRAEGGTLAGCRVLELGPGHNFGALMILACCGAQPVVADRFLVPWEKVYHGAFYTALRAALRAREPDLDVSPLSRLITAGRHAPEIISSLAARTEDLHDIATDSVDIVLSNAVLEHLADPPRALAQLFRITKPGGLNLHQVDFRDHRDFTHPLEYLLMDTPAFEAMFEERHGECGRPLRPREMEELFRQSGFTVRAYRTNIEADPLYLDDFMPRLRAASASPYQMWQREDLTSLSGRFHLLKPLTPPGGGEGGRTS